MTNLVLGQLSVGDKFHFAFDSHNWIYEVIESDLRIMIKEVSIPMVTRDKQVFDCTSMKTDEVYHILFLL